MANLLYYPHLVILTLFYFFYFLFKGKSEWKCERKKNEDVTNCCVVAGSHWGSSNRFSSNLMKGLNKLSQWTLTAINSTSQLILNLFSFIPSLFFIPTPSRRLSFCRHESSQVPSFKSIPQPDGCEFYSTRLFSPPPSSVSPPPPHSSFPPPPPPSSFPPPPPPPPPPSSIPRPPPSSLPISLSQLSKTGQSKDVLKGGIAVFPPSMMEDIIGTGGGDGLTTSEVNRTPNRTVRERLRDEREDGRQRAKSEEVSRVSRIEGTPNNEAQFIFRAMKPNDGGFTMGSSVHNGIYEREDFKRCRMEDGKELFLGRSDCTPDWSRVSTPVMNREDETGVLHRRRGSVHCTARNWPPLPNAQGADIGKEEYVDSNGRMTCRRIVERKNEESWKWFDEKGRLLDERMERTLMGDRDEVMRSGPFNAQHFSQHFYIDKDGNTQLDNMHRQYNKDYIVESFCRNY